MPNRLRWAFLGLLAFAPALSANEAAPAANDPALEKRVQALAGELRCLVCQNQTLADSNAPLALDLRNQIREQLGRGSSERDVVEFMVARYGDFVLYRPPLKATTVLLWVGPFLFVGLGIFILIRRFSRKRPEEQPMSDKDRARAAQLLGSVKE
jgi:cytochrome c-type biogenesis protein CcmH